MSRNQNSEVLVVGAGPVGLLTALLLSERGVEVEIVDSQWHTAAHSYALALHPSSLELLDSVGAAEEIILQGHRIDKLGFYDGDQRRGEIDFSELPGKHPYVLVVSQQVLEDTLVRHLTDRGIDIWWSHRVAALKSEHRRVSATIERLNENSVGYSTEAAQWVVDKTFTRRLAFVVGADGHHSVVRRALGFDFEEILKPQFFAVFEYHSEKESDAEQRVVLDDATSNVLWPMGAGGARWSFQLDDSWEFHPRTRAKARPAVALGGQSFPHLDEKRLHQLAEERAPWFDSRWPELDWSIAMRFDCRLAKGFGKDNMWLVGDAAHLASPLGVHSMNVGMLEADDLASCLSAKLRGGSTGKLEEYAGHHRRRWQNFLTSVPMAHADANAWVKKRAARIPQCIPASGKDLELLLQQLGLELPAGG
jgi:2-polyprenyl-6-methoxyphenol hydroxylase-like FAD-dependent oxidoreductase